VALSGGRQAFDNQTNNDGVVFGNGLTLSQPVQDTEYQVDGYN